jgi:type IV pilus assembly protein PilE
LIELMVVVLIATILLTVAVPTYQYEIRKSRRTDAKTAVLDLASREERYYASTNAYSTDPVALGYSTTAGATFPQTVGSGYYQVTVAPGAAAPSYIVTATPVAGSPQLKDSSCQSFSVTNTGVQSSLNSAGASSTATCWP